eukprot:c33959_g1_i1.p1 GENE.c33959_g1_i1~~c33959_g1_i1.p1  ORF type:complete len:361 (+),score=79.25 c33959_g1_i1:139-1221(+)
MAADETTGVSPKKRDYKISTASNPTPTTTDGLHFPPLPSPAGFLLRSPQPPENMESILLEPFSYLCEVPGKDLRTQFAAAFNCWLNVSEDKVAQICDIINMLHTASLMVDDIEDNSELRRGIPVAHMIYGIPQTINSANYVYFLAMEKVTKLGHPSAVAAFLEELLQLHRGQGLELYWRDNCICPTLEQYQRMVMDKTGGLFRLAVRLMQLFSSCQEDLMPLVNQLSLFYQIRDDYINLSDVSYQDKKGFCEDLTEGKFSFPIICAITVPGEKPDSASRLLKILEKKTSNVEVKKYAVTLMEQAGAFKLTRKTLERVRDAALSELTRLGGNKVLRRILLEKFCQGVFTEEEIAAAAAAHP